MIPGVPDILIDHRRLKFDTRAGLLAEIKKLTRVVEELDAQIDYLDDAIRVLRGRA